MRELILLYGELTKAPSQKYQRLANNVMTCGYREYAENFGCIVYPRPVKVSQPWGRSISDANELLAFIEERPDALVWSVKKSPALDKHVLNHVRNPKLYYPCGATNLFSKSCDINLVDTDKRRKKVEAAGQRAELYRKGKDPGFWAPVGEREYDYVVVGLPKPGKNQKKFIQSLAEAVKQPRRILWVGGSNYGGKVRTQKAGNHEVVITPMLSREGVRDNISKGKVGILYTQYKDEGFPQSFLELTMCGLPVLYRQGAPANKFYFHKHNCAVANNDNWISEAERLLAEHSPDKCREEAVKHYSIQRSYQYLNTLIGE